MIPCFSEVHLRQIANAVEGAVTHRTLSSIFRDCRLSEQSTCENVQSKAERIVITLRDRQTQDRCGNNVVAFIQAVMNPVCFLIKEKEFKDILHNLNQILSFLGLQIGEDATIRPVELARNLTEAAERAGRLRKALNDRRVHSDVLKFCREELLQDNYFHAVFEATKSIADKLRALTGLNKDGSELVDKAFGSMPPILAINSLQTESEISEHRGFANLMKGLFGTFRNVTAHAPKIKWPIEEQDALDLLSMASFTHRRLDKAVKVPLVPSTT